jgi:hypothetical protein
VVNIPDVDVIVCRSYTRGRRFPKILGKIAGFALPFLLSMTQVAVFMTTFLLGCVTYSLWSRALPGSVPGLVLIGIPVVLTVAVRFVRIDGRAPLKALAGYCALLTAPRGGVVRGRPQWAWTSGRIASGTWLLSQTVSSREPLGARQRPTHAPVRALPVQAATAWDELVAEVA